MAVLSYRDIPGWFDFEDVYRQAVAEAPPVAHFVEIGSWLGRSTVFMCEQIQRSKKKIQFDAVDTWEGSPEHAKTLAKLKVQGRDLFADFQRNIARAGMTDFVRPVRKLSLAAAEDYADGSLDFIFVDGDHRYGAVLFDLRSWRSKLKFRTGVMAGHDFCYPPVRRAVREVLGSKAKACSKRSWIYYQ